nr:hypothetical protein [Tanacetum cinerariifolium]
MFPYENAHHIPSLPAKKIPYPATTPQPNSLQAQAKKLMQKAKKNMRKINFKKAVAQKFREYDQKLKALINFNEAFEKVVQAKVLTEIQKLIPTNISNAIANYDELTIADLEGVGLERLKVRYNNDVELKYHVCQLKVAVLSEAQWNIRRSDDKKYEFRYVDLHRLSVNDVEDMYLLQVQDKLHHLPLEFMKDFNHALLMFIRRTVIKNRVEDIQLGVERYQRTLNLTKPIMFFKGIDQRIPFTMTTTHKGVVYLNQYKIKSLKKLSEVKKFYDGTLVKIENLIDMLSKNKLVIGNKSLNGRD